MRSMDYVSTPAAEIIATPAFQAWAAERRELVRLSKPLYLAMLGSIPFYKEREHDDAFWTAYIGSAVTEASTLVARSKV
jgi:hypothetical protein